MQIFSYPPDYPKTPEFRKDPPPKFSKSPTDFPITSFSKKEPEEESDSSLAESEESTESLPEAATKKRGYLDDPYGLYSPTPEKEKPATPKPGTPKKPAPRLETGSKRREYLDDPYGLYTSTPDRKGEATPEKELLTEEEREALRPLKEQEQFFDPFGTYKSPLLKETKEKGEQAKIILTELPEEIKETQTEKDARKKREEKVLEEAKEEERKIRERAEEEARKRWNNRILPKPEIIKLSLEETRKEVERRGKTPRLDIRSLVFVEILPSGFQVHKNTSTGTLYLSETFNDRDNIYLAFMTLRWGVVTDHPSVVKVAAYAYHIDTSTPKGDSTLRIFYPYDESLRYLEDPDVTKFELPVAFTIAGRLLYFAREIEDSKKYCISTHPKVCISQEGVKLLGCNFLHRELLSQYGGYQKSGVSTSKTLGKLALEKFLNYLGKGLLHSSNPTIEYMTNVLQKVCSIPPLEGHFLTREEIRKAVDSSEMDVDVARLNELVQDPSKSDEVLAQELCEYLNNIVDVNDPMDDKPRKPALINMAGVYTPSGLGAIKVPGGFDITSRLQKLEDSPFNPGFKLVKFGLEICFRLTGSVQPITTPYKEEGIATNLGGMFLPFVCFHILMLECGIPFYPEYYIKNNINSFIGYTYLSDSSGFTSGGTEYLIKKNGLGKTYPEAFLKVLSDLNFTYDYSP